MSKSFISNWTGLDPSNVKRGLTGLVDKKIILKRLSKLKNKCTFEYEVAGFTGVEMTSETGVNLDPENQSDSVKMTLENSAPESKRPGFCSQNDPEVGGNLTPKIKVNKNKFNLTLENKTLRTYFEKISDDQKFFPEQKSFEKLRKNYSESEISKAYLYLQENGTVGRGARCPVPMSYLLKAMERVLELVQEKELSRKKEKIIQDYQETQKALDERNHELLTKKRKLAEKAFYKNFPTEDEQNSFVEEFFLRRFKSNYKPSMLSVRRMIAITDWYENYKSTLARTSLPVNS